MKTVIYLPSKLLKQSVEQQLSVSLSDSEYEESEILAKRKLARIIEREGDADGEKQKLFYLVQLIKEAITAERFSLYCHLNALEKKEMPAAKAARQI